MGYGPDRCAGRACWRENGLRGSGHRREREGGDGEGGARDMMGGAQITPEHEGTFG